MRSIVFISFTMLLLQGCTSTLSVKQAPVVTASADKIDKTIASAQPAKQPETDCRQLRAKTEDQDAPLSATASAEERLTEEAMRIKRLYVRQIYDCWRVPQGTSGLKAAARVTLSNNGDVSSVIIASSGHSGFDDSVEEAVRRAAPFKLPVDEALRKRARNLIISFKSK